MILDILYPNPIDGATKPPDPREYSTVHPFDDKE